MKHSDEFIRDVLAQTSEDFQAKCESLHEKAAALLAAWEYELRGVQEEKEEKKDG